MHSSKIPKKIQAWIDAHPHVVDEVLMDDNDPNENGEWSLWCYLREPYKHEDEKVSIHVDTVASFFTEIDFVKPKIKDINLTGLQIDFITHRLGAPDAIAESFTDCHPDDDVIYPVEQYDEITQTADDLLGSIEKHKILKLDAYSKLQQDIIIDCFEGNTWFAGYRSECEYEDNPQKFTASERSIDGLAEKLKSHGLNIGSIPKI